MRVDYLQFHRNFIRFSRFWSMDINKRLNPSPSPVGPLSHFDHFALLGLLRPRSYILRLPKARVEPLAIATQSDTVLVG